MPNWKVLPTQMTPGLIVPVVLVPEVKVFPTGVCRFASTNGISRLTKSGRPRSTTDDFKYGMLYWIVPPQLNTRGWNSVSAVGAPAPGATPNVGGGRRPRNAEPDT